MQGLKPVQKERLGKKFAAWLLRKHGSLDAASRAWEGIGQAGDDLREARSACLTFGS